MVMIKISEKGLIAIPAEWLEKYRLVVGERVILTECEDGRSLHLSSVRESIKKGQAIVAKYKVPGESIVDELIRERREEASRE